MRCFISAEMPEDIKKQIEEMQKCFSVNKKIRFTNKKNMHITLKFLGDIDSKTMKDIDISLKEELTDTKAPKISAECFDAFPNQHNIRGVWLKFNSRELKKIKEKIDNLDKCRPDTYKTYRIHATLFRTGNIDEKTREHIIKNIDLINKKMKKINFSIDKIELKRSELKEDGPVYTTIRSYCLKDNNRQ